MSSTIPASAPQASGGLPSVLDALVLIVAAAMVAIFFRLRWNRLRNAPQHSRAIPPAAAMALLFGFLLLGPVGTAIAAKSFGIISAGANTSLHDMAILTLGAYIAEAVGLGIFIHLRSSAPRALRGRSLSMGRSLAIGIVTLLCTWPVLLTASNLVAIAVWLIWHQQVDLIAHESLRMFIDNPPDRWYAMFAALVIVVAPIMEEVMYRGLLQTALVELSGNRWRSGRWPAVIATSAVFALMHGSVVAPHALAALFVLSLALGWVYEKTGRLATTITMHAIFNGANLLMAVLIVHP